ncbi:LysE family translocator [Thiofilum flexile]|uniref:LysE family translocator n=1 Tax=Thiofilum flexile TaxID=125627 RepID=UPI00039CF7CE|nr:LysE family translocator [Thiofilum flexile]
MATITPGPAVLLATTHSLSYGWRSAVFTILGNISGLFIMSALSVLGLSVIILGSEWVFSIIKYIGAAYLIYLGIKFWRNGLKPVTTDTQSTQRRIKPLKLYLNGLAVALSNPKAIAFTTALFPQFIKQNEPLLVQFSILVLTFMALSFFSLLFYASIVHTSKAKVLHSPHSYLNKVFGAAFVLAGVALANVTYSR